jgi:hypothetical protein
MDKDIGIFKGKTLSLPLVWGTIRCYFRVDLGPNVTKHFLSVNLGFLNEARVFFIGKLFQSFIINTLALYENP